MVPGTLSVTKHKVHPLTKIPPKPRRTPPLSLFEAYCDNFHRIHGQTSVFNVVGRLSLSSHRDGGETRPIMKESTPPLSILTNTMTKRESASVEIEFRSLLATVSNDGAPYDTHRKIHTEDIRHPSIREQATREDIRKADFVSESYSHRVEQVDDGQTAILASAEDYRGSISAQSFQGRDLHEIQAAFAATDQCSQTKNASPTIREYILLASAVSALAAIGPFLALQDGCTANMKLLWRTQATCLLLAPFALNSVRFEGLPHLTKLQWLTMILTSLSYAMTTNLFVVSLAYTAVGNAVILANCQAVLMLGVKLCRGEHVTCVQAGGALVAFGGVMVFSIDSKREIKKDGTGLNGLGHDMLLGNLIALLSGIAGLFYLQLSDVSRKWMNLHVFMFLLMMFTGLWTLLLQVVVLKEHVTLNCDLNIGVCGWLNTAWDRLPLEIAIALVW